MNNLKTQKVKRDSIDNGFDELESSYDGLVGCISTLKEKLDPILLPSYPVDSCGKNGEESNKSALHIRLSRKADMFKLLNEEINMIISRIDI